MASRVLHLGWKPEAEVEALHRHGAQVTCAARPSEVAAARESPFLTSVIPVADPAVAESVLAGLARSGRSLADYDLVTPANEFELVTASVLNAMAGRPGLDIGTALRLRDKFLQKEAVREAGVRVTDCRVLDSADDLVLTAGQSVVVKPLSGAGTIDTYLITNDRELEAFQAAVRKPARLWLCEDFVDGSEIHLDGVVRAGVPRLLGVSRYLNNVIDIKAGIGAGSVLYDRGRHGDLYSRADSALLAVMKAASFNDGVFHIEMFEQADSALVFSELGGRAPGGGIVPVLSEALGISLHDEWARAVLDIRSRVDGPDPVHPTGGSAGWLHLRCRPGRVTAVPDPAALRELPGVIDAEVKVKVGEISPDMSSSSMVRAGRIIVTGADEAEVEARLRAASGWFDEAMIVVADGGV